MTRRDRRVALTFDDGPGPTTAHILDVLEHHGVVATFFVVGSRVAGRGDVLQRMVRLGCEIGNHTYSHRRLEELTKAEIADELQRTSDVVQDVASVRPAVMRPPFGRDGLRAAGVANRLGMTTAMYTVSVHDWDAKPSSEIERLVLETVRPDGVVLLHDAGPDQDDRETTAEALRGIVPALQTAGYRFVTITELLRVSRRARRRVVPHRRSPVRIAVSRLRGRVRA